MTGGETAGATIGRLVGDGTARLRESGSPSPRLDAELLLGHVLGIDRAGLLAHPELAVPPAQVSAFAGALERRAQETNNGYPSAGHALLVGYVASPLRSAGDSAGWSRRERAVLAFQVAASPGLATDGPKAAERQLSESHPGRRSAPLASAHNNVAP